VSGPRFAALARPVTVNGGAGLVVATARGPIGVIGFTVPVGVSWPSTWSPTPTSCAGSCTTPEGRDAGQA
jgi:hypothetical protein